MSWLDKIASIFGYKTPTIPQPKKPDSSVVSEEPAKVEEEKPKMTKIEPLDLMSVTFVKAENQSDRKDDVRAIVLHHTGPGSFNGLVKYLASKDSGVSVHYVLGAAGELTQLVNTSKKAWHAGLSEWTIDGEKRSNLNNCTIGIEIVNIGVLTKVRDKFYYEVGGKATEWTGATPVLGSITYPNGQVLTEYYAPYPEVQATKLVALCKGIIKKYPQIGREDILTHFQISIPIGRKNDPFGLDIEEVKKKIFDE